MKLTKLQSQVAQFASRSEIRYNLACVKFDNVTAVATDSFSLVEIKKTSEDSKVYEPLLISRKTLEKVKTGRSSEIVIDGTKATCNGVTYPIETGKVDPSEYPKYDYLFDEAEKRGGNTIRLSGEYLAEIAAVLAKVDENIGAVEITVPAVKHYPVVIKAQGSEHVARALLMPLNR